MSLQAMFSPIPSSCLVQVRAEPGGQFTAQLLGLADVHATAATRGVGSLAANRTDLAAGGIEDIQRRRRCASLPEGVEAAAIEILT
jgi:hypothetical protein